MTKQTKPAVFESFCGLPARAARRGRFPLLKTNQNGNGQYSLTQKQTPKQTIISHSCTRCQTNIRRTLKILRRVFKKARRIFGKNTPYFFMHAESFILQHTRRKQHRVVSPKPRSGVLGQPPQAVLGKVGGLEGGPPASEVEGFPPSKKVPPLSSGNPTRDISIDFSPFLHYTRRYGRTFFFAAA